MIEGREAISNFLGSREDNKDRHTVHSVSNVELHPLDDGDAVVRAVVMIHASVVDGLWELERVTRIKHVLRFVDGEFLIAERRRIPLEGPAGGDD